MGTSECEPERVKEPKYDKYEAGEAKTKTEIRRTKLTFASGLVARSKIVWHRVHASG